METRFTKALLAGVEKQDGKKTFRFRISTETVDRAGEIVTVDGWLTTNYLLNPVVLLAHDYRGLPIGRTLKIEDDPDGPIAEIEFSAANPMGGQVAAQYEEGTLNAVSVGFQPRKVEVSQEPGDPNKGIPRHVEKELLEISAVAIPANPEALIMRTLEGLVGDRSLQPAITEPTLKPFPNEHACRLRDPGDFKADSFRRVSRTSDGKRYAVIMGRLKGDDSMTEQSFRYPKGGWSAAEARAHCKMHDGMMFEAATESSWKALGFAMAGLFTGRLAIEDEERRTIYLTLAEAYRAGDYEPPEFRTQAELSSMDAEAIRDLFWAGEPELWPELFEAKVGRVLSKRNEGRIREAVESLQQVLASLEPVEESTDITLPDEIEAALKALVGPKD